MGHIRLGVLPKSKKWTRVVEELRLGADVSEIASSTAAADETSLENPSPDPPSFHAFWLLARLPLAARGPEFIEDLRRLGVTVSAPPGLMDLLAGFSAAVDQNARARGGRTDLGEMAQMAAVESLAALVGPILPSLFRPSPEEVQRAIGRFGCGDRFSALAREVFARLTQRTLAYYLSPLLSPPFAH